MAVTVDSQETSSLGHHSTTSPLTWSFTNTAGNLLVVGASCSSNLGTPSLGTVSYNGVAMTRLDGYALSADGVDVALYYLVNPATGSNTVSVSGTFSGGSFPDILGGAISFAGADTTTPLGTAFKAKDDGAGSSSASVGVTGTTSGNKVVDALVTGTGVTSSNQTLSYSLNNSTHDGADNIGGSTASSNGSTVTMGYTVSADWWFIVAAEVKAAAASGTTGTLAANLTALSASISGTETISGTIADNLTALSISATGTSGNVSNTGTIAANLTALSISASGLETFTGTAAANLTALRCIARSAPVYPLKASSDNKHIVDQNGNPVLLMGDSVWSLDAQGTNSDIDLYLADRAQKGYNAILFNVIEHKFSDHAPNNIDNVAPFTGATFTTPNNTYFNRVDYIVQQAANYGIVCLLFPLYLGFNLDTSASGEGWAGAVKASSTADMQSWATYLAGRYGGFSNIIWVIGGDANSSADATIHARTNDFATQLATSDTTHLITAHNARGTDGIGDWPGSSWLTLNTTYSSQLSTPGDAVTANAVTLPFFEIESQYEGSGSATAQQVRSQPYWTILGGGSGHMMGNTPVWALSSTTATGFADGSQNADWKQDLNSKGANSMIQWRSLFSNLRWVNLVPSASSMITAGGGSIGSANYVGAARTSDGTLAYVYIPTGAAITVDMTKMLSAPTAQWYDPTNGTFSSAGTGLTNTGTHVFTPSTNAGGDADMVLMLTAPNTATVAANLTTLSVAATGVETFTGTVAANLTALSISAAGTAAGGTIGSSAITLTALTISASGTETFTGTSSANLTRLTIDIEAQVLGHITGTIALTLASIRMTAAGLGAPIVHLGQVLPQLNTHSNNGLPQFGGTNDPRPPNFTT